MLDPAPAAVILAFKLRPSVTASTPDELDVDAFFTDCGPYPRSAKGVRGGNVVVL